MPKITDPRKIRAKEILKEKIDVFLDEEKIIPKETKDYQLVLSLLLDTEKGKQLPSKNVDLKVDYAPSPYAYSACFYFKLSDSTEWNDFSMKKAGKTSDSIKKGEITQAFRFAIDDQIKDFLYKEIIKSENKHFEELKRKDPNSVHVDHKKPSFANLLRDFLEQENLDLMSIKIKPFSKSEKQLADLDIENKWRTFHKKYATLQLKLGPDNIKKGAKSED